jgi:putative SOS response-associated peptidase YedK
MCGRFVRKSTIEIIAKEFEVKRVSCDLKPSYNIAPGDNLAVIIDDGANYLIQLRWGLIPSWAKDPSIGNKMINARAETLSEKPSFKAAFRKRRCLIVADGFYEWRKDGRVKTPVYIRLKSERPFGFAGLYDSWTSPEGKEISTCTIITTGPNELMKPIHDRMPVIIPKAQEALWLDSSIQDERLLFPVLKPYDSQEMEAYDVSQIVNSPKNNSPECIKPVSVS